MKALVPVAALMVVACSSSSKSSSESSATSSASAAAPSGPDAERAALETHLQKLARDPKPVLATLGDPPRDARDVGVIGLLSVGGGGDPNAPTAPWGRDDSGGANLWGDSIGDSFGPGPGGVGNPSGPLTGPHRSKPPQVRAGASTVKGRLPPEVIQRIVRMNFGRFRLCYENGLKTDPTLAGRVSISFTINADGSVADIVPSGDIPDQSVIQCVGRSFGGLSFPQPEGGVVKVVYPISFSPGESAATVGGKAIADVTADDVKAALEKAGCTDVAQQDKPAGASGPTLFTAKKDGRPVTVKFVSSKEPRLELADRVKLADAGALFTDGAFLVAVAFDDRVDQTVSKALLDAIVVRP